VQIMLIHLKTD